MKNSLILVALALLACLPATAQKDRRQHSFTLGPRLGLNYSTLVTRNPAVRSEYVLGYQAGVFVRADLGPRAYLQPEVYFNSKGSTLTFQDTQANGGVTGTVRFSSVDVPVLLGRYLVNARQFKVRLLAGPMLSFNLKTDTQGMADYNPAAYQFKERVWGGQVGLGLDIGNLAVDARYETGFEKINPALGQRPQVFNLSAAFKLF